MGQDWVSKKAIDVRTAVRACGPFIEVVDGEVVGTIGCLVDLRE